MLQKLEAKGCDEALARQAVAELSEAGMQSDARFLECFVRTRFEKGYGPARIQQALRQWNLGGDALEGYDWDQALQRVYAGKYGASLPESPKEYAARMRFLSQRGFSPQRIRSLLRQIGRGDDEYFEPTLNDNP